MERREAIMQIMLAVFLTCLLQLCSLNRTNFDYSANYDSSNNYSFGQPLLTLIPMLVVGATKKYTSKKFCPHKRFSAKKGIKNKSKVGIFTGIEAKTDHAIFEILDSKGPLTTRQLLKLLNLYGLDIPYYSSLNKRIHALERGRYIGQVTISTISSRATLYELRPKFYLAQFLSSYSADEILSRLTDTDAEVVLADLLNSSEQTGEDH